MARAEGREGLEGLVCHGLGVEVVVEVVAVVGGGAADNGGDGGDDYDADDENFSVFRGGGGNGRRTSSSPLATSPSRVAAARVAAEVAMKMTEEIFPFSGGGVGNQKGAFKVFFCHFVSMSFLYFFDVNFLLVDQGMQLSFSLFRPSVCMLCLPFVCPSV